MMKYDEGTKVHDNQTEDGLHKKIWYKPTLSILQMRETLGGPVIGFGEGTVVHRMNSTFVAGTIPLT